MDIHSHRHGSHEFMGIPVAPTFLSGRWEHLHVYTPIGKKFT